MKITKEGYVRFSGDDIIITEWVVEDCDCDELKKYVVDKLQKAIDLDNKAKKVKK